MIVVTDNGALAHLILIGQVDLLARLYDKAIIPTAVAWEFEHAGTPEPVKAWASNLPTWAKVASPTGMPDRIRPGAGEREAIRLAKEQGGILLSDDRRAVLRARLEGLLVTGSLGVLIQAHANGWLELGSQLTLLKSRTNMYLPSHGELERLVQLANELREANRA